MVGIKRFEDIIAWQKARALNKKIYRISETGDFKKYFPLKNQIRKATISIMLNIAEGFGRNRDREFGNYLNYSNGSAAEVQSALYIALDLDYISQDKFDSLYSLTDDISSKIISFRHYLQNSSDKSKNSN